MLDDTRRDVSNLVGECRTRFEPVRTCATHTQHAALALARAGAIAFTFYSEHASDTSSLFRCLFRFVSSVRSCGVVRASGSGLPPLRPPPSWRVTLTYTLIRICLTNLDLILDSYRFDKYRTSLRRLRLLSQQPQPPMSGSSPVASTRVHHLLCRRQRSSWTWSRVSSPAALTPPPSSPPWSLASSRPPGNPTFICLSPPHCPPYQLLYHHRPTPSSRRPAAAVSPPG